MQTFSTGTLGEKKANVKLNFALSAGFHPSSFAKGNCSLQIPFFT